MGNNNMNLYEYLFLSYNQLLFIYCSFIIFCAAEIKSIFCKILSEWFYKNVYLIIFHGDAFIVVNS